MLLGRRLFRRDQPLSPILNHGLEDEGLRFCQGAGLWSSRVALRCPSVGYAAPMTWTAPPKARPWIVLSGVALAMAAVLALRPWAEASPPNVVLIVLDSLRRDHLGAYGYRTPTTPVLDGLAAESLVVEDASANAPWTKPSVGTLFTSLMPAQHRAIYERPRSRLADGQVTIAEVFAGAGYATAGFSENPNIHTRTGFAQGFDSFRDPRGWLHRDKHSVREALRWVEQAKDAPFFLYLHFLDPHTPYQAPPPQRKRFTAEHHTDMREVRQGKISAIASAMDPRDLPPGDLAYLKALYDAEIHWVDREIGRFLDELEAMGLSDRTVVLVTSDHGEEFLENGRLAHGPWLSVELLQIPLLLRVPGAPPRRVGNTGVAHIDVAPTLLELAGVSIPPEFQGESFADLVHGRRLPPRTVRAETHNAGTHLRSVREGPWKLVRDEIAGQTELFHLERDPDEDVDVAGANPDVVARLSSRLGAIEPAPPRGQTRQTDRELEKRLRALGYLGGEP